MSEVPAKHEAPHTKEQLQYDALVQRLATLDFEDPIALSSWIDVYCRRADNSAVQKKNEEVIAAFAAHDIPRRQDVVDAETTAYDGILRVAATLVDALINRKSMRGTEITLDRWKAQYRETVELSPERLLANVAQSLGVHPNDIIPVLQRLAERVEAKQLSQTDAERLLREVLAPIVV